MRNRLLAVALGGAVGAVLRWGLTTWQPDDHGFPWTTFAINVTGSLVLALLPALSPVRRSELLTAGLGPGLLGGFTTLSAYSEQTRALLAAGHSAQAATYVVGTVAACLVAVAIASNLSSRGQQQAFETAGGDE